MPRPCVERRVVRSSRLPREAGPDPDLSEARCGYVAAGTPGVAFGTRILKIDGRRGGCREFYTDRRPGARPVTDAPAVATNRRLICPTLRPTTRIARSRRGRGHDDAHDFRLFSSTPAARRWSGCLREGAKSYAKRFVAPPGVVVQVAAAQALTNGARQEPRSRARGVSIRTHRTRRRRVEHRHEPRVVVA